MLQGNNLVIKETVFFQRNKAPNEQAIPLLMPQHHMVIPHYMGRSEEMEIGVSSLDNHKRIKRQDSFSSRSSFQDIPLLLPQDADVMDAPNGGDLKSNGLKATPNGLTFPFRKPKVEPVGSEMPMRDFVENFDLVHHGKLPSDGVKQPGMKQSDLEWWETQERGNQGGFTDESGQVGPRTSCRCQVGCYSILSELFISAAKIYFLLEYHLLTSVNAYAKSLYYE